MKRYRAVDVPPKFRRTAKARNTRLGESVYFSRFFSAYNLVYLKFFLMWIGCITLDFLIGFRFELLWPVWLLIRHLYESFRVHAFSSSLHYSAFSVFFVCVTATSDLVCYLFIPIQVLIFLASTYVWVQFVYQSTDRGVCVPSLFLWALFIVFEYSVRYRFDNATWYLTRTSWITSGIFPSTADSISIGLSGSSSSASASPSSTRLELYRPFAAHCIGFPVVTLGFRVKSFFSNWRMRIRREEVMRQNEFFERLLADAIPTSFENRKHFISSGSYFSVEQDGVDYELAGYGASDLLNGLDANGQPRLYSAPQTSNLAAICAPSCGNLSSLPQHSTTSTTSAINLAKKPPKFSKQSLKQNGIATNSKRNGITPLKLGTWRSEANGLGTFAKKESDTKKISENGITMTTPTGEERIFLKIWRVIVRFFCLFVLSTLGQFLSILTPSMQQMLEGFLAHLRGPPSMQDDLISTSGEGSNIADEEDWDHDSNHCHGNLTDHQGSKKKSRRTRVLSSVSQTSVLNESGGYTGASLLNSLKTTASSTSSMYSSVQRIAELNGDVSLPSTLSAQQDTDNTNECFLLRENAQKMSEIRHLQKEKQMMEISMDKLKAELKNARNGEYELRSQLTHAQQQEQSCREEWKQFEREQRQRIDQLESKCKQLGKQNDHAKTNIQALERRVGELQLKKLEIERELANERLSKQHSRDDLTLGRQQNMDHGEFKLKLTNLDRELKTLKKDMKAKNEHCTKLEDELRQLHSANNDESKQIELLRQKNFLLEQTLSSENKLKQDLFRALNDSKAAIASLKTRLHAKQIKEQNEMMNAFRDSGANSLFHSGGGSTGSSPTAQQQHQFPLSQQKSLTPPPLSVASSTFNLEQLLQATQNMSYSLGPLDANGTNDSNNNNFADNSATNTTTSLSPYTGGSVSEMLAVGGHRTINNSIGGGKSGGSGN